MQVKDWTAKKGQYLILGIKLCLLLSLWQEHSHWNAWSLLPFIDFVNSNISLCSSQSKGPNPTIRSVPANVCTHVGVYMVPQRVFPYRSNFRIGAKDKNNLRLFTNCRSWHSDSVFCCFHCYFRPSNGKCMKVWHSWNWLINSTAAWPEKTALTLLAASNRWSMKGTRDGTTYKSESLPSCAG